MAAVKEPALGYCKIGQIVDLLCKERRVKIIPSQMKFGPHGLAIKQEKETCKSYNRVHLPPRPWAPRAFRYRGLTTWVHGSHPERGPSANGFSVAYSRPLHEYFARLAANNENIVRVRSCAIVLAHDALVEAHFTLKCASRQRLRARSIAPLI